MDEPKSNSCSRERQRVDSVRGLWSLVASPWSRAKREGGFALLITITLLAFLVVLLVGLASYMRVETAIAGNTQRQTQARQNALMALDVALGQLQKYAGPDQRVTATGEAFGGIGAKYYTGVWDTTTSGTTALTWLVSGSELPSADPQGLLNAALNPSTEPTSTQALLVGNRTVAANPASPTAAELARRVKLATQTITAVGVPGNSTVPGPTIGRYAWWVGDNGVKADVARGDASAQLDYAPFVDGTASTEMRKRIYQQAGLGAGSFENSAATIAFDARDTVNQTLANNTISVRQLFALKNSAGTQLGLAKTNPHFHNWTAGNYAVLANTNAAASANSLRTDLSLNPSALGSAFTAWANYSAYMEAPNTNPLVTAIPPSDTLRRRYRMTPPVIDANGSQFSVAPVLSYLSIGFSIRNNSDAASRVTNLECSMRCVAELWNPYTSALVPENLEILITGLPSGANSVVVSDTQPNPRQVDLQAVMGDTSLIGNPIRFSLPWINSTKDDEYGSWLPGRVYNWSAQSNPAPDANGDNPMFFDTRRFQTSDVGNASGIVRNAGQPLAVSTSSVTVNRQCFVGGNVTLQVELRRASDSTTLAKFRSPPFDAFPLGSNPTEVAKHGLDFAFVFRAVDPTVDNVAWLQTASADPRLTPASPSFYTYVNGGNSRDPAALVAGSGGNNLATIDASNPSLLLDRYPGTSSVPAGTQCDEDVPVFELPRSPLLSVGELQHLTLSSLAPFTIGNSAASIAPAPWRNSLFDQYFFSGLDASTNLPDPTHLLPNVLLRALRHKPDGTALAATDFTSAGDSSKFLLQGGAFNLNSTDPDAWAAVLRSVRFPAAPTGREFAYVDALDATGTNSDSASSATLTTDGAAFLRFAHSAQETFKTTPGYIQSVPQGSTGSIVHTEYYRQGLRLLDPATVKNLATTISAAVKTRLNTTGPFATVEDFLNPAASGGSASLLEQAITALSLNANPNDSTGGNYPFSSSFLTQADLMTALAPVLFPHSDTFTIRAYGEALNPTTGQSEGKAWCEAIVQRFPEPFAPATVGQPTDAEYHQPPGAFGRRFKIVSFRWLTKSDI